mgnify:CR=1 FL=1
MEHIYDAYNGLWRSSAMEKTPYTEDFPEALLVLPELFDGAIAHGRARKLKVEILRIGGTKRRLRLTDPGRGLWNETRFKQWAASESQTTEHRNGHGHKKAMTKFAPDYKTASWTVRYRKAGNNLITLTGPFMGDATKKVESDDDETTLMPSGTETTIDFDSSVLGQYADDPRELLLAIKEIICTRYSEKTLREVEFQLEADRLNDAGVMERFAANSRTDVWHSFRWHVEKGVEEGYIRAFEVDRVHISRGAPWTLSVFKILQKGNTSFALKHEFPTYGKKSPTAQRVHIALMNRTIELAYLYPFKGRQIAHNDDNGLIVFVNFTSDDLTKQPQPSTTKVTMYPNDEIYVQFVADLRACLDGESYSSDGDVHRPAAKPERALLIANDLGVSFHMRNGQVLVDFKDGTGMKPLTDYKLTPNTA